MTDFTVADTAWVLEMLVCPQCKNSLTPVTDRGFVCSFCQTEYPLGPKGQPDLRVNTVINKTLPIQYDPALCKIPEDVWRLPESVANYLPQARQLDGRPQENLKAWLLAIVKPNMVVLDLGAKSNRDKELVEKLGGKYVAVEIAAANAMVLGDAHAIPLPDQSVDIVMCMSVFEHLKNPYLAAQEIRRVLKTGGYFIGIVGFLEAVHGLPHGSYFHHSYLGIYTLLTSSRFSVQYLATFASWAAIHSISRAMFIGIPKRIVHLLIAPMRLLQNSLWYLYGLKSGDLVGTRKKRDRILSASVHFVATRPD